MKKYVLFAGVNGSGKSTLYNMGGEYMELPRVNTDEFRRIAAITNGIEEIKSTNLPTWFIKFYNE